MYLGLIQQAMRFFELDGIVLVLSSKS